MINNNAALVQIMAWSWQAIMWSKDGLVYWRMYVSLNLDGLNW